MRGSRLGRFVGLIALFALFSTLLPPTANAADLRITSAADSGPGTLREALSTAGPGTNIIFDPVVFPPNNPTTIAVASPLPSLLSANITLDASNAGVILDGSQAPVGTNGLILERSSCTVLGLTIRNFPGNGIFIAAGANSQHDRWESQNRLRPERPGQRYRPESRGRSQGAGKRHPHLGQYDRHGCCRCGRSGQPVEWLDPPAGRE